MDIYLPEIDNKGIDFVVRSPHGHFFEIQCKAVRQLNYFFVAKTKFPLSDARYLCLLLFVDKAQEEPQIFLIPSRTWEEPNTLFVDRPYVGKKSAPEWGLQFSVKNMALLEPFRVHVAIREGANKALEPTPPARRGSS